MTTPDGATVAPERLRLSNLAKSFGAVRALDDVTMAVGRGVVHGLLGENGAGKSTLLRILSGVLQPTAGRIAIDGAAVEGRGPGRGPPGGRRHDPPGTPARSAHDGRAEHVPRPALTRAGGLLVARRAQERAAAAALAALDPSIDPAAPIRALKVAQRQIVEIARAVLEEAKVIAMDEPTSSLTPAEFERLAVLIGGLAAKGVTVVYVSHKMDEVFRVCSSATILRDGRKVADVVLADTSEAEVVARMVGRDLVAQRHVSHRTDRVALSVRNLSRGAAVADASFELHEGEVLGVSGLVGAGRTELLRLVAGVDAPTNGEVVVAGKALKPGDARAAIAAGLGLLPEERKRDGIVPAPVDPQQRRAGLHGAVLELRIHPPPQAVARERDHHGRPQPGARSRSSVPSASSAAATSRRRSSAGGSRPARASCCSTSRRAASTSAPRPRSTP